MAQFENMRKVDLANGEPAAFSLRQLYYADENANRIGAIVLMNGEPFPLSGTCTGTAIRADGTTVPMTGTVEDNQAYITLIADCYAVEGDIQIFVKLTTGDVTATLVAAIGTVRLTETGAVIDPGEIIPSVSALITAINDAVESIPADYSALLAAIAPAYADLTFPVTAGTWCWYSGSLYRAKVDIPASETWTAAHWDSATLSNALAGDVAALKSAAESLDDGLKSLQIAVDTKAPAIIDTVPSSRIVTVQNAPANGSFSVVSDIVAVQQGTGTPTSSNIRPLVGFTGLTVCRAKKNLCDIRTDADVYSINTGYNNTVRRDLKPGAIYQGVSGTNYWLGKGSKGTLVSVGNGTITFTSDDNAYGIGIACPVLPSTKYYFSINSDSHVTLRVAQYDITGKYLTSLAEPGYYTSRSDAAYYLLVFTPKTAYTGQNLTVSNIMVSFANESFSAFEGAYFTTSWETVTGAVYGGSYNSSTGELTVTHDMIASYDGETLPGAWVSDRDEYAEGTTPTTGAQVVYELSAPQTYQAIPMNMTFAEGFNYVWSNAGNIVLTQVVDTETYIQSVISPIEAKLPNAPAADGSYMLNCTVSSDVPTYSWSAAGVTLTDDGNGNVTIE